MKSVSCSKETIALVLWLLESGNYRLNAAGEIVGKAGVLRHGKTKSYPKMEVVDGNGLVRHIFKHTFIAIALWGPVPDGHTVNHKDGVKWNIAPDNLEVIPHRDNIRHSHETGLQGVLPRGEKHHWSRLSDKQVREVLGDLASGITGNSIAKRLGVTRGCIYRIRDRSKENFYQ